MGSDKRRLDLHGIYRQGIGGQPSTVGVMDMEEPNIKPNLKLLAKFYVGAAKGNAELSAKMAGYSKNYARSAAYKLIARDDVQEYITYLNEVVKYSPENIASIQEIQHFWTDIMNDKTQKTRDRIRASELLAKVQGAFKEDDW